MTPDKFVWIVGVCDCEANEIKAVCATKEIAERELFKVRDELVVGYKKMVEHFEKSMAEFCEKEKVDPWYDPMYRKMIENLSGNDYEKWDNYPHNKPYLYKVKVIND